MAARPKMGDNMMSLSQLSAVCTFSYGKIFHKPFSTQTPGVFLQYPCCPVSVPSQRLLLPFPLSAQASPGLFGSTVYIFCCVLEKMCLGFELNMAVPFSCELSLLPVWGRWLETGFCWLSGSDHLARKGHKSLLF